MLPSAAVMRWLLPSIALAAGCGRFQFDRAVASDASVDAAIDAALDASVDASLVPAPLHRYPLAGSFADDQGGPPLTGLGGAFEAGGYRFALNQGLRATDAVPLTTYTIDVTLAFDQVAAKRYQKIIDFKDLSTDEGFYVFGESLDFVIDAATETQAIGPAQFSAGTVTAVTLTRASDGVVTGYVDRVHQFEFTDPGAISEFTHAGRVANFAIDDNGTGQLEAGAGIIRQITIWDVALTAVQVAALR